MKAKLLLKNGRIFEGLSVGAQGSAFGEICFNTEMSGYQEVLTNPSYDERVVVFTYPEIGNCGMPKSDTTKNKTYVKALVMKNYCQQESHYKSVETLGSYLKRHNIVAISNIDTREITSIIRKEGKMSCIVTTEDILSEIKNLPEDWNTTIMPQKEEKEGLKQCPRI